MREKKNKQTNKKPWAISTDLKTRERELSALQKIKMIPKLTLRMRRPNFDFLLVKCELPLWNKRIRVFLYSTTSQQKGGVCSKLTVPSLKIVKMIVKKSII